MNHVSAVNPPPPGEVSVRSIRSEMSARARSSQFAAARGSAGAIDRNVSSDTRLRGVLYRSLMNLAYWAVSTRPVLPVRVPVSIRRFSADQERMPYRPIDVVSFANWPATAESAMPFGVQRHELKTLERPRLNASVRICAVSEIDASTAVPSPAFQCVKFHAPAAAPAAVPVGSNLARRPCTASRPRRSTYTFDTVGNSASAAS